MDSSNLSPATRTEQDVTMSPSEMTATSAVPPPISTTMLPVGSATGRPAPMAAAMGSSMSSTWEAPACRAASSTARRSTSVTPDGMHTTICGFENIVERTTLRMKCLSMVAVMSKSAITPSLSGRTATIDPGVRPIISLAAVPTASTVSLRVDRHNGRLTHHNALAFHENQGVRGAEINADIAWKTSDVSPFLPPAGGSVTLRTYCLT